jgi:hypothetical protein
LRAGAVGEDRRYGDNDADLRGESLFNMEGGSWELILAAPLEAGLPLAGESGGYLFGGSVVLLGR